SSALYHFMGYHLMGRPLKLAWFDPKDFAVLRDIPTRGERMPNYLMQTVCVTGFDSSLEIGTIRHALEEIFANDHMKKLVTPVNLDGTSTGKAYIRYDVASSYNGALHCDGVSEIGGRILRVTKWPDFSWCKKRRIGRAGCDKDDAGLAVPDQDDTPKWHTPSTGNMQRLLIFNCLTIIIGAALALICS
ncbi:Os08g0430300, partial [Oryza sativa Japonica Group]